MVKQMEVGSVDSAGLVLGPSHCKLLRNWRFTVSLALCLPRYTLMWNTSDFLLQLLSLLSGGNTELSTNSGENVWPQEYGKLRKEVQGGVGPSGDRGLHTIKEENLEFPWVLPTLPFQVLKYQQRLKIEDQGRESPGRHKTFTVGHLSSDSQNKPWSGQSWKFMFCSVEHENMSTIEQTQIQMQYHPSIPWSRSC